MSQYNKWKENELKNKELMKIHQEPREKKKSKFKRLFNYLFSFLMDSEKYKITELITNWGTSIFVLAFVISLSIADKMIIEEGQNDLSHLEGITMVVLFSFFMMMLMFTLKGVFKIQRKKGVYWPTSNKGGKYE